MKTDLHAASRLPVQGGMPAFVKTSDGQLRQTDGRMMDSDGTINASSKRELQEKVQALAHMMSTGQIRYGEVGRDLTDSQAKAERKEKLEILKASFAAGPEQFKIMAEVYGEDIIEVFNRQGFTSQVIARKDVVAGHDNRVALRRMDVSAFQVMADGNSIGQILEQDYVYPQPYNLQTLLLIEEAELSLAGPEFLDKKIQDALQATMVRQDNILRNLMLRTVGVFNAPLAFTSFTPQVMTAGRTQLLSNGLNAEHMIIAYDLWNDIIADPAFTQWWEPVHKYELIQRGYLGSILGMKIITDGVRYNTLRVLQPGEVFWTAHPAALGQRGVHKEMEVKPVDHALLGAARRGAFLHGLESMIVMDRAAVGGQRV